MEDIDDLDVEILEIINKMPTKAGEEGFGKRIKLEPEVETPPSSPISRTDSSEEVHVTSIKVEVDVSEPQIEMLIDGVSQTMELEEEKEEEEEEVEGEAVDESLPFCRLCYITFSSHAEQLPHEQKVNFFFFFNIS